MKKLLLILICLILSSQSYGWELINKGPSTDTYIDKIKRSGDKGYFWSLFNNSDGTSFVVRFEVECISERMRDLTFMKYSNHFGEGTRLQELGGSNDYKYPEPGTVFELYYNRVCKK